MKRKGTLRLPKCTRRYSLHLASYFCLLPPAINGRIPGYCLLALRKG